MKTRSVKKLLTGLAVSMMLAISSLAFAAPIVDVIQAPSGYFVPSTGSLFDDPYYRWEYQDWAWQHNALAIDAADISSAVLSISAWDVDFISGEIDNIYAYSSQLSDWVLLGALDNGPEDWSYTDFVLGAEFYDDILLGLQIRMDIDINNAGWAVTLAKSVLNINGGNIPDPDPTPTPEPGAIALMGAGLASLFIARRRFNR